MRRYLEGTRRLVVRAPNWVGDIVMATPLFDCLRASFPQARIACVIRGYAQGIVRDGPWFNQVITAEDKSWGGFWTLRRQVAAFGADTAVLLPNSLRSALPIRLAGVRKIYGYRRSGRGWLLTDGPAPVKHNGKITPLPMTEYYLEIARFLGLNVPASPKPTLYVDLECQRRAEQLLVRYGVRDSDRVIGLNPGANFGSSKCWPAEHFARLAEMLIDEFGCKTLLFSGPGEEQIAEAIVQASKAPIIDTTPDKVKLDLLKPLVKRCDLLVTNDTGPRHYAVAFDVPVVVIMGPTDPRYTAANLERTEVIRIDLPCSGCHKKTCPTTHQCMVGITAEMVLARAQRLMASCGWRV